MARGRRAANYFGRTKGHSVLPQRNYGLLNRSRYYLDDDYQVPGTYRPSTSFYHGSDYYVADAMTTHATNLSTDAVYDNMDLAARSRGKDQRLMSQVNAALNPETVPQEGSQGKVRVARATSQRLLQRYFPEAPRDCVPKMSLRELETLHLGGLPEYRKPTQPAVNRLHKVVFDDPVRKVGGGGSMRQWLADGLTKTRTMFRKEGEGSSEFRWLDSPSIGELDSPDVSDPFELPYSSYDFSSSIGSDRGSPDRYSYENLDLNDDLDDDIYYTPYDYTGRRKRRANAPRPLHSIQQLRRRRRRRERNRSPSFVSRPSLLDNISLSGSDYNADSVDLDSLDDYPLSQDEITRQTRFLPYEPAPPYPTTKIYSDFGNSLPKISPIDVSSYTPSVPIISSNRVTPSAILFNSMVSNARRRALANIPDFSNLDTSNIIFSIEPPLPQRATAPMPRKVEFELPVTYGQTHSPRPYVSVTPASDVIASFRPNRPVTIETRGNLDLSKPIVVSLEGGDDFFSKFLSQRKQFRDTIMKRLDDGTENKRVVIRPYTSYYNTPHRTAITSRHSPEPDIRPRDRNKRNVDTSEPLALPSLSSRTSHPIRALVSLGTRDPLPSRYSSYDRTRPREIDDDSMSLVPVNRAIQSRPYSCERDNDESSGTLTTLDRIRLKAYASPSTPARARASRRANRQQQPQSVTPQSTSSYVYSVPPQVPYFYPEVESRFIRGRSLSPNYLYRRPVAGRARARTSRRGFSVAPEVPVDEPVIRRGRAPVRASPVRYLPWCSPTREAELALSPTRLENSRSRETNTEEPYVRGFSFAYPYRTALWGKRGRLPWRSSRWWSYPSVGSNLSGYPFGNTNWIINPQTACNLGVKPIRAGREGVDPLTSSRWFWGPSWLDYEMSPRLRNFDRSSIYDPRFDITPSEAVRFGIEPSTAANWNAASPIRTGRWDMAPSEGMTWETPEEPLNWNVYPLRAGSPRGRSVSPLRSQSQALSRDEAARWGITPSEAAIWSTYPSSRNVALERYERARSLSPVNYRRARSVSPVPLDVDYPSRSYLGYLPRSRSLSPSYRYGVDPPYSLPRFLYPFTRPRDVSPLRFSPLPIRTRRDYAVPRFAKKAIVPSKLSRRVAARRSTYVPFRQPRLAFAPWTEPRRPPVVVVYLNDKERREAARDSPVVDARSIRRISPDAVNQMLKRFQPRKPYEDEYSGKVAAARAIARAMTVIPQGDFQAAIISPNVEVETKRKTKGPKSKYAAAVMRELRLNPKEDAYVPYVNRDRYDRFNLRSRANADRVYSSGSIASKAGPRPSSAKAYRDSEGYSKPKNLLSWQYRIQSYTDPSEVFYTPASVYKMRDRVRDVQERLDMHRQMLDRYLEVDLGPGDDVAARIARKQHDLESRKAEIEEYKCDIRAPKLLIPKEPPFRIYIPKSEGGSSGGGSSGGSGGGQPSALRQRLRKVLCKSRNDPTYYKD